MSLFTTDPILGHITTFGGHPVCCAAGMAGMKALLEGHYIGEVKQKEGLFRKLLVHEKIRSVRSLGLMIAVEFDSFETNKKLIDRCIEKGILTDWFLFAPNCMRIVPPLIITEQEIEFACRIIVETLQNCN